MKLNRLLKGALVIGLAAPAFADGRNPGSALIFPVHRSGPDYFTIVCVTNTNMTPSTPFSFGGSTDVHYEYANVVPNQLVNDPFTPQDCIIFNRVEFLTPADTLCVLTACHNATQGNQEGYLVVSAEDPAAFGTAWAHNYLVGSELVINSSGGVYAVNAIPFNSHVAAGGATDLNGNGQLDFDDNEYEGIADTLIIDSFIGLGNSHLALINLTGNAQATNNVQFTVWNDNEFPLSTTRPFNCWFDVPLPQISTLFTDSFLKNSTPHDPSELDIDCQFGSDTLETGWALIDSLGVTGVSGDGALLGSITVGVGSRFDGGHLLWESEDKQFNGTAFTP